MSDVDFRYFPDVFSDIVAKVRAEYDPDNNILPIFKFGSYLELVARSKIDDNNKNTKYPLIWLVWDELSNSEKWEHDQLYEVKPRIFICTPCKPDKSTTAIYASDGQMKTILYPLLAELERQIFFHDNVESYIFNSYTKNDHPHWGENYTNEMFDTLSAIEVQFDKLRIMKFGC